MINNVGYVQILSSLVKNIKISDIPNIILLSILFLSLNNTLMVAPKNNNNSIIDILFLYSLWNKSCENVTGLNNNTKYITKITFLLFTIFFKEDEKYNNERIYNIVNNTV